MGEEQKDKRSEEGQKDQRSELDSIAPVVLDGPSDEETTAAMNKGKGRTLIVSAVVLIVVFGGIGVILQSADEKASMRDAGKAINGIKKKQFDRFWGCVLPGQDLRDIRSNADLVSSINRRGSIRPLVYGRVMRDKCSTILQEIGSKLDVLQVPKQLQKSVSDIKKSIEQLSEGWQEYIVYLTDPELKYDDKTAQPHLNKIAVGWYGFKKSHAQANKVLKEYLE